MWSRGPWKSSTSTTGPAPSANRLTHAWRLALLVSLATPIASSGHDIPDSRVDRAIQVDLQPGRIEVRYTLSLSEWTLYQDLKALDAIDRAPTESIVDHYAAVVAPLNAAGLIGRVNETPLEWTIGPIEVRRDDHLLLTFEFDAPIDPAGSLVLTDSNYASAYGTSRLALRTDPRIVVDGYSGPASVDEIPERPIWDLDIDEETASKHLEIAYRGPGDRDRTPAVPEPGKAARIAVADPVQASDSGRSGNGSLGRLLLDANGDRTILLCLAAVFAGMVHALQPGHGKTLIVSGALADRGSLLRLSSFAVALVVTHFALALALGGLILWLAPDDLGGLDTLLKRGAGLLIGGYGAYRVGTALNPTPATGARSERRPESIAGAVLLGGAIGAIPCWETVVLLLLASVSGQLQTGILLVAAFGIGSAAVLLGLSALVGTVRRLEFLERSTRRAGRIVQGSGGLLLGSIGALLLLG